MRSSTQILLIIAMVMVGMVTSVAISKCITEWQPGETHAALYGGYAPR